MMVEASLLIQLEMNPSVNLRFTELSMLLHPFASPLWVIDRDYFGPRFFGEKCARPLYGPEFYSTGTNRNLRAMHS
jgi:hypothetical protein